ncbi:MAG: helix-turn-helix transcriptional regulator [Bacteroidota bacterium]
MSNEDVYFLYGFVSAITLMACIHGALLAAILLVTKRLRSTANRYLALALAGVAIILFYEAAAYAGLEDDIPLLIQYAPLYIQTSVPVGLFFFTLFMVQPEFKPRERKTYWLAYLPLALDGIIQLAYIPLLWMVAEDQLMDAERHLENTGEVLMLGTALTLLPLSIRRVHRYQSFLYDNYSTTSGRSLRWLRTFLMLFLTLAVLWGIAFTQSLLGLDAEPIFLVATFGLVIVLFAIGYFVMLQYDLFEVVPYQEEAPDLVEAPKKLSAKTGVYFENLLGVLQDERVFTNPELTLQDLADRLGISAGYLSQIIKAHERTTFFEFVNRYRVEAVKQKLVSADYQHYTIMGVALESGFKSKSTFNTVFKKFTGQTPSAYKHAHLAGHNAALLE